MILGTVTPGREAVLPVRILGLDGREIEVEAGIDTGYNGFLTLPKKLIEELALPFGGTAQASLGDGSDVRMEIYVATVLWDGSERPALVLEAEGGALVGMAMLDGCRVTIDVEAGGPVIVESLPASTSAVT